MNKRLIPNEDLQLIIDGLTDTTASQARINYNLTFSGKTVVIIGCAGFLGRIFLSYFDYLNTKIFADLNLEPVKVVGYDNFIIGRPILSEYDQDPNINVYPLDIIKEVPDNGLKYNEKVDFILNCSGIAEPSTYRKFPQETLDVSYLGIKNSFELALHRQAKKILVFSSSEVYGNPPDNQIPTSEDYYGQIETMGQRSCYDVGKLVLETLSHVQHEKFGVPVTIVKPFNVYAYVSKDDTRVLPNFIKAVLAGNSLKVYGVSDNTRTFCFITDAIIGFLRALLLGKCGRAYNIGNPSPEITMSDLAKLVIKITNHDKGLEIIPYPNTYPSTEPHRRCPNISRAQKELGYSPQISLEQGVTKFYNWAKENWK